MSLRFTFFLLIGLMLLSCEEEVTTGRPKKTDTFASFKQNNFQFILSKPTTFNHIKFKLPETFNRSWSQSTTITRNSLIRYSKTFKVYFTVESFTEQDIHLPFMVNQIIDSDLMNAFHDAYVNERLKTLDSKGLSIKKEVTKKGHFPLIFQTVRGTNLAWYDEDLLYVTATMKVKNDYYVFQWIGEENKMQFMFDDFFEILNTVKVL